MAGNHIYARRRQQHGARELVHECHTPVEDIQELKVSTNNSGPDVGTYGGAQVNAYIKSRTNNFHGGVYEYFKDRSLNANTWANDLNGVRKAPYRNNDYGALLGGPIKKDKAFFFAGYEGIRLNNGFTYTLTLPTALMRQGYFLQSQFSKGIYDPQTKALFPLVQAPGGAGAAYFIDPSRWDPVARNMLANTNDMAPDVRYAYATRPYACLPNR